MSSIPIRPRARNFFINPEILRLSLKSEDLKKIIDKNSSYWQTVFIVGNGAVTGGLEPIKHWSEDYCKFLGVRRSSLSEKHWDLNLVHMALHTRSFRIRNYKMTAEEERIHKELYKQRQLLAEAYRNADTTRNTLPRQFEEKLRHPKTVVICLNWDTAFFRDPSISNILQIHGICSVPESIILPSEYALDLITERPFPEKVDEDIIGYVKAIQSLAMNAVDHAKEFYVWGASLSAYDAEVIALLGRTRNQLRPESRLWVINPDETVAERAATLMGKNEYVLVDPITHERKTVRV